MSLEEQAEVVASDESLEFYQCSRTKLSSKIKLKEPKEIRAPFWLGRHFETSFWIYYCVIGCQNTTKAVFVTPFTVIKPLLHLGRPRLRSSSYGSPPMACWVLLPYRIYPCISRTFKTSKSVQKFALDLYMGNSNSFIQFMVEDGRDSGGPPFCLESKGKLVFFFMEPR